MKQINKNEQIEKLKLWILFSMQEENNKVVMSVDCRVLTMASGHPVTIVNEYFGHIMCRTTFAI